MPILLDCNAVVCNHRVEVGVFIHGLAQGSQVMALVAQMTGDEYRLGMPCHQRHKGSVPNGTNLRLFIMLFGVTFCVSTSILFYAKYNAIISRFSFRKWTQNPGRLKDCITLHVVTVLPFRATGGHRGPPLQRCRT